MYNLPPLFKTLSQYEIPCGFIQGIALKFGSDFPQIGQISGQLGLGWAGNGLGPQEFVHVISSAESILPVASVVIGCRIFGHFDDVLVFVLVDGDELMFSWDFAHGGDSPKEKPAD